MSQDVAFHDVFSLDEPSLLDIVPRPSLALIFVYPHTAAVDAYHDERLTKHEAYEASGPSEPILYIKQSITNACGLMALMHSLCNGIPADEYLKTNSTLSTFVKDAISLQPIERSQLLENSNAIEHAYARAADTGNSTVPELGVPPDHSFTAFVKDRTGRMWELSGRKAPIDLGMLDGNEDLLSEAALDRGPRMWMALEKEGGGLGFSCISLGPSHL